jgi:hypothetical protein
LALPRLTTLGNEAKGNRMGNRFLVNIDNMSVPIDFEAHIFVPNAHIPRKIGDDVMVTKDGDLLSFQARFLKSHGMCNNTTYLVDIENLVAYPYKP